MGRKGTANVIADAHYLPFVDNSFSVVRCWHVLEHCRDPRKAASEAKRVGGVVNAKFPYRYDRVPWVLSYLSSFHSKTVYGGLREVWIDVSTKTVQRHHPLRHLWMVRPIRPAKLNRLPVPGFFVHGRKARLLHRLTFYIPAEWECWL
jgi:ubiquinone/menaquinone biosynthesis C-methylase UbiE